MENSSPAKLRGAQAVGFSVSSSGVRNIHARSKQACSSPGHSRNGGDIRDCFQSHIQGAPLPPLLQSPRLDRRRRSAAIAVEWVLVERNSPSHPDCRPSHSCRRDSSRHLMRCRRPITPRPSTLGNNSSCRYLTARSPVYSTGIFRSGSGLAGGGCAAGQKCRCPGDSPFQIVSYVVFLPHHGHGESPRQPSP